MKSISQVITCQFTVYYEQFIIVNYISEHQLLPVIDTSHTTPTTLVNRNTMLLKLIEEDVVHALAGSRIYSEPRPQFSDAEPGRTARYSVTVTIISL